MNLLKPQVLLTLCSIGLICLACSSAPQQMSHAYYETTLIKTPQTDASEYEKLKQMIPKYYEGKSVIVLQGSQQKEYKAKQLVHLSHPILRALWIVHGKSYQGAEFDLKIRTPNARTPVTVYLSKTGKIHVETGRFIKHPAPSVDEIEKRWELKGIERSRERGWSERARRALHLALSLVSPQELKIVRKLPIKRVKRASQANRGAVYEQETDCSASITLYDVAVSSQSDQFIGDVSKPNQIYPITTMVLLHEIGHAVHNYPARRLHCAYLKSVQQRNQLAQEANATSGKKRNSLHQQVKLLDQQLPKQEKTIKSMLKLGPVLKAYQKKISKWSGPTRYAKTSLKESFAESYALFYADPKALKRVHPKVYAWFLAGEHLKEMLK